MRNYIVPAAKHMSADLLEFSVPDIADGVSGRKDFRTAAKSAGNQSLRKQLGSGSRKMSASRAIQTKSAKLTGQSRRDILTNISR